MTRPRPRPQPPRFVSRLLFRALPRGRGSETILGDLHEEYNHFRPAALRNVWYVVVALTMALGYKVSRPDRAQQPAAARRAASLSGPLARFCSQDLRYAVRGLLRQPAYALAGVLTLALGIGATTAIVTVVYSSILKPLPFAGAERVMRIGDRWGNAPAASISSMTVPTYLELQERSRLMDGFAAFVFRRPTISGSEAARHVLALQVTPRFLEFLAMTPRIGRDITPSDAQEGAMDVVLLSDALWRRDYDADPAVVGRTIAIDLVPHAVVGVVPAEFTFPSDPVLLVPLKWSGATRSDRRRRNIEGLARMAPGVTPQAALAELNVIFATIAAAHPEANSGVTMTGLTLHDWMVFRARPRMLLFGGAVVLVLLIACVNVANLLIARAESREREIAVCAALGADRLTLALRALADSVVLGAAGGVLGIAFAFCGVRLLVSAYAGDIPRASHIQPDITLLLTGLSASLAAAILAGILPAMHVSARRFPEALRSGGRSAGTGRHVVRRALVVVEVALAVVLVSGAALLLNSLWRLSRVDLGISQSGVLTFSLGLPAARYGSAEVITRTFHDVLDDLEAIPGITTAGGTTRQPLFGGTNGEVSVPGAGKSDRIELRAVTPGYFAALGMRVVSGRAFTADDARPGGRNVVVNESFVRRLLAGNHAVGRPLTVGTDSGYEIIGVVSDVREFGPETVAPPVAFWATGSRGPSWSSSSYMTIVVRTDGDPPALIPSIRERLAARDRDLAMDDVFTLGELARRRLGRDRQSAMSLFGLFALLALVLGAVGIYGVISFNVQQRTRELGIRMALGASSDRVRRLIVGEGIRLALIGTGLGVAAAIVAGRTMAGLLFEVRPTDPSTLAAVAAVVLVVSAGACTRPAARAARLAPIDALRHE